MKKMLLLIWLTLSVGSVLAGSFNLTPLDVIRTRGQYYDLAIENDMLFLANKLGIEIYDISQPATPVKISQFTTRGLANGVAVNLPYIYVGDVYGFSIWDISDINNPVYCSGFKSDSATGYQERLYYRDGRVIISAYTSGLQVVDVTNPHEPRLVSQTATSAYAWDMVLTDSAAYVMDFFSMSIIDIRRPDYPVFRKTVDAMFANGAAVKDNKLYLGYVDGLRIMDITDPFEPVDLSDIGPTGSGTAETVALHENYAFVGHGSYIEVYDITDDSDPVQISYFYPPGHPRKLQYHNGYLYTVLDDDGFIVTDVRDPYYPVPAEHINGGTWGTRNDVHVKDNYLFLSDWNRGLIIYDITNPSDPVELTEYSVPGSLREFVFQDNYVYIVGQTEIQIVDISNPASPVKLGFFRTSGSPQNVFVKENRCYLCDQYGLYVLDISNPENITRLGAEWLAKDGNPYDVYVENNYGFVANGWKGMKVVDLSDETDPDVVLTWPGDNSRSYVSVEKIGNYLYFLNPSQGIDLLDVSSPLNPVEVSRIDFDGLSVNDYFIEDTLLFLAAGEDGIFVWDIKDPEQPVLMARTETPGDALGVAANSTHVYGADEFDLSIIERDPFTTDVTPPVIEILAPDPLEHISEKRMVIHGLSSDSQSGVRLVEISFNQGETWSTVYGQETWSYFSSGHGTGPVPIQVRALDWSGLYSDVKEPVWVYFDPPRPEILLGGFENTYAVAQEETEVTLSAIIREPWDAVYINEAIVTINGQPTETVLKKLSSSGDYHYYQVQFIDTFTTTGLADFGMIVTDVFNNKSIMWPEVPTKW